jgi:hypothetical protein
VELTDTPSSYAGMAASGVRVTAGADGLEFFPTSSDIWQRIGSDVSTKYHMDRVVPNASGTQTIGASGIPYAEGWFDDLYVGQESLHIGAAGATITSPSGNIKLSPVNPYPLDNFTDVDPSGTLTVRPNYSQAAFVVKPNLYIPLFGGTYPMLHFMDHRTGIDYHKVYSLFGGPKYNELRFKMYDYDLLKLRKQNAPVGYRRAYFDADLYITGDLETVGEITASGVMTPDASGAQAVGTVDTAFGYGYFDNLEAANSMYAATYYGDGSNLTNLATSFIDLTDTPSDYTGYSASGVRVNAGATALEFYNTDMGTSWSDPVDSNIIPDTSGYYDIGSPGLPFASGYFETITIGGVDVAVAGYVHEQVGISSNWTVPHMLGTDKLVVQITDNATPNKVITPKEIIFTDDDTINVTFPSGVAGEARVISTSAFGGSPAITSHDLLLNLGWSVAGHIMDADIVPNASGTIDLGSLANAFAEAYIDHVHLKEDPTMPLQAATKQYADNAGTTDHDLLNNLNWASAGHTIDANIMPDASGTRNLGSAANRFDTGYFDDVDIAGTTLRIGTASISAPSGLLTFTDASGTWTLADLFTPPTYA